MLNEPTGPDKYTALDRITSLNERIAKALLWLGAAGLVIMTIIIGWQVYARYVLNASPSWAEQASLLLMVWYALLAAAAGFQQGFHIKILAGQNFASPGRARIMRIVSEAVVILCGVMMFVWGIQLSQIISSHVIPSLGISRSWAYLPLPIAGALITLFCSTRLIGELVRPGWTEEPLIDNSLQVQEEL